MVLPGVLGRQDHSLNAAVAEAARDKNTVERGEAGIFCFRRNCFRVDPPDVHHGAKGEPGMTQGLRNGEIGVVELHIFPHKTDGHSTVSALDGRDHSPPLTQIRLRCRQTQLPADHRGQICLLQIERRLIENGKGQILNDAVRLHVAEVSDFAEDARIGDWLVTAQNDDVRGDPSPCSSFTECWVGLDLCSPDAFR